MESTLIKTKLAEKFGQLYNCSIPLEIPSNDIPDNNCIRFYYDGAVSECKGLQRKYKFRLRCFSDTPEKSAAKADTAVKIIRNAQPETFSGGGYYCNVHHYNIDNIQIDILKSAGNILYFSEIKFSVII